jgi:hypothetical protein
MSSSPKQRVLRVARHAALAVLLAVALASGSRPLSSTVRAAAPVLAAVASFDPGDTPQAATATATAERTPVITGAETERSSRGLDYRAGGSSYEESRVGVAAGASTLPDGSGPAPAPLVEAQPTLVPGPPRPITHEVQEGESLGEIADLYDLSWMALAKANAIGNPNKLQVGQVLKVPPVDQSATTPKRSAPPGGVILDAAFRSQSDGTASAGANCGPATLGMFLSVFGESYSSSELRDSVNEQMGISDPNEGSTWEALAYAANVRGYTQYGLYGASIKSYRAWSVDDLLAEVNQGRPVMLLVYFRALPGHENDDYWGDHYILFLGIDEDGDVVFHDPAFRGQQGAFRTMTKEQLLKAWTNTAAGISRSAMGLRPVGS